MLVASFFEALSWASKADPRTNGIPSPENSLLVGISRTSHPTNSRSSSSSGCSYLFDKSTILGNVNLQIELPKTTNINTSYFQND